MLRSVRAMDATYRNRSVKKASVIAWSCLLGAACCVRTKCVHPPCVESHSVGLATFHFVGCWDLLVMDWAAIG